MKKILFIIVSLVFTNRCLAQKISNDIVNDPSGNPFYYTASASASNAGLTLTIDKSTKWIEYHNTIPNQPLTNYVFLEGTKEINLFLVVPKDSIRYFRYSIIENDVNWLFSDAAPEGHSATNISPNLIGLPLGKFNIDNKKLTIESYKISDRNKVATVTIYNKSIKPAELFLTAFALTNKKREEGVSINDHNDSLKFKIYDSVRINSLIVSIKPSDLTFIYHVYLKNLSSRKIIHISNNWNYGYFTGVGRTVYPYLLIDAAYFTDPGDYEIDIIPQLSSGFNAKSFPSKATKIHFTVLKSAGTFSEKEVLEWAIIIITTAGTISGLAIYFIKRNNKHKLLAEQHQRDYAQMQLAAIRSQLNPHFMFNALSGIQNLMNKNDPDQANRYLTKFARVTRSILNNNDRISLQEETDLLNDYLQMEQLRFRFQYSINVDAQINPSNCEIPSMLLQPLVENAVKHGIGMSGENGTININISQRNNNLIIFITDNGAGFDTNQESGGLGLTLTRKRIALLNSIYKDAAITLDIQSALLNTTVTVTLNQWL